jgi:dipeptidyl aminopeptidase/acylaminoacyl peptidase
VKLIAAATGAILSWAGCALAEPPPASAFGTIPPIVRAELSPNGKRLAILGGAADQRIVSIATIDQPGLPIVPLGSIEGVTLQWAGNDVVIARVAVWEKVRLREEYRFERNIAISAEGKVLSRLLGTDTVSQYLVGQPVLGVVANGPVRVLVGGLTQSSGPSTDSNTKMARKGVDNPFIAALWSVDPTTGKGTLGERGDYDTIGWAVDSSGQARVRLEIDQINHNFSVMGRAKGASQWSRVWAGGDLESERYYHGYSEPDDAVYLTLDDRLVRKKLSDGTITPAGDFPGMATDLEWDHARHTAVGAISGGEKPITTWLDPELGAVHATLAKVLKGKNVALVGWSDDRTRFVVRASSRDVPGAWYLFDRTRKELSPLGEEYPDLKGAALGSTRWITYKARDGLEIPAYLTLPPGAPDHGAKAPLIVLPHGGPGSRDGFDFDFLAQFLATRGYAVLQPQFRGSWGFGKAFEDAGKGEWAGKMQTDLLDGVAAVAASGDADSTRVCIVGASYGGYAALAAATMHADAYRCAASIAGISDLGLFLVEVKRTYGIDSAGLEAWRTILGDAPIAKLAATSPGRMAANVHAPLLLIHGDKDTVVPIEQSQVMAKAMEAAGKPVEFVTLADENHYLVHSATRTQMLQTLDTFLAKNLPVKR